MRSRFRLVVALAAAPAILASCTSSGSTPSPTTAAPATSSSTGQVGSGSVTQPSTAAPSGSTASSGTPTAADWPTYNGNVARTGVSSDMPPVSGAPKVTVSLKLDEAMYASPVVSNGIVIAASEGNTVYAVTADGKKVWQQNLGAPSPAGERPCGNIDPLGITGTPVIVGGVVYVAPELGNPVRHELAALDLHTGKVLWRRSLDLPGVETVAMQERGALTVSGGRIWVPFGGLAGDCGGYKGRVIGVRSGGAHDAIAYTVPTTREAGIWTPPGPAVDSKGDLFVAVGNGESGPGDSYDFSDSVLRIDTEAKLVDSYSPRTWPTDNAADLDLGSQGPALVGEWVFSAGKSGTAYVLRRSDLGGIGGEVSQASVCKSFGGTAVSNDVVYVPCTDGVRAVRIDDAGTMHVLWHADTSITGSPVVGGGRVWALDQSAGVLHALDPATGKSREQVDVGVTSRFATPALHGADVLVPTLAGLTVVRTS